MSAGEVTSKAEREVILGQASLQARLPPPGGGVWSGPGALFLGADWDGGALGCAWAAPPEIPGPSSLVIFVLSGLNQALSGIQGYRRGSSVLLGPQAGERRGEGHAGGTWMHKPIAGGSDLLSSLAVLLAQFLPQCS